MIPVPGWLIRILLYLIIIAGMVGSVAWYFHGSGYRSGVTEVQALWDADKLAAREAHDELVRKLAQQEAVHAQDQEQIAHDLAQAKGSFDVALAAQRRSYEQRLLQSSRRDEVYRDQAQAGPASCEHLAGHAAELDRALEEGRGLVGELRETLGLRESQIVLLGKQIIDDRKLFEGEAPHEHQQ